MKKSLVIALLLICLSIGFIASAFYKMDMQKTALTIEEETLYGDKSFAKGITMTSRTHVNYHLFWDTVFTAENSNSTFRFSQTERPKSRVYKPELSLYTSLNMGMSGLGLLNDEDDYLLRPAKDVASMTLAGEVRTETVYLKDYYDFYPVSADLMFPDAQVEWTNYMHQFFSEYLKIPILKSQMLEVSISKNKADQVTDISLSTLQDDIALYSDSLFDNKACYFVVMSYIDTSENPFVLSEEASGIHMLPLETTTNFIRPLINQMELVYPVDPSTSKILDFAQSTDERYFYLFTLEDNAIMISVIDKQDMTCVQKLTLNDGKDHIADKVPQGINYLVQQNNFIIPFFSDGKFSLLNESNSKEAPLSLEMSGQLFESSQMSYGNFPQIATAYDGDRLAMIFYQDYYQSSTANLLIYRQGQLLYTGRFQQSTDNTVDRYYSDGVHPVDIDPLSITFD